MVYSKVDLTVIYLVLLTVLLLGESLTVHSKESMWTVRKMGAKWMGARKGKKKRGCC